MPDVDNMFDGIHLPTTLADWWRLHFQTGRPAAWANSINPSKGAGYVPGFGFVEMTAGQEGDVPYTRREDQLKNNAGQRNMSSPLDHDYRLSDWRGENKRGRRSKQRGGRFKDRDIITSPVKKSKAGVAPFATRRKFLALLFRNDELGITLLVKLRAYRLLSTSALIDSVRNGGVNSVTPALTRLKRAGLISLQDDKFSFSCTDAGYDLLRRIEELADEKLHAGLDTDEIKVILRRATQREFITRMGSVMKRAQATAQAKEQPAIENLIGTNEDPNYQAYLRDTAKLQQEHGRGVVAYANGTFIAFAPTIAELEERIPDKYWKGPILIKDVPEKVMKFRRRVRIAP